MKLRLALGLGAFALFSWVLAPAAQAQLDNYKCYQGKDLKAPKFTKLKCSNGQNTITSDQFTNECVDVQKVKFVCNPVAVGPGGVINDPTAHLICYQIKGQNLAPRPKVEISTQFQISQFEIKKPKLLCVPGTKTILP